MRNMSHISQIIIFTPLLLKSDIQLTFMSAIQRYTHIAMKETNKESVMCCVPSDILIKAIRRSLFA